jgi:hypothetical protein
MFNWQQQPLAVQQLGNAIGNAITRIRNATTGIGNNSNRQRQGNAIGNAIGNSSYQYNNWHTRPDGVQAKEEMPGAII